MCILCNCGYKYVKSIIRMMMSLNSREEKNFTNFTIYQINWFQLVVFVCGQKCINNSIQAFHEFVASVFILKIEKRICN